jgi:hypothetical protein
MLEDDLVCGLTIFELLYLDSYVRLLQIFGLSSYTSTWYHVIFWWEIARIPFNIIMLIVGVGSFQIAYVSIPLVYLAIGFLINIFFTLTWIVELSSATIVKKLGRKKFRKYLFCGFLTVSVILVVVLCTLLVVV